jgi:hypothetical protein
MFYAFCMLNEAKNLNKLLGKTQETTKKKEISTCHSAAVAASVRQ